MTRGGSSQTTCRFASRLRTNGKACHVFSQYSADAHHDAGHEKMDFHHIQTHTGDDP